MPHLGSLPAFPVPTYCRSRGLFRVNLSQASYHQVEYSLVTNDLPVFLRRNVTSSTGDSSSAGNVANPQSSSSDAADINASRATDSLKSPDNAAASRTPTSNPKETNFDETTPTHGEIIQDPSKPDAEKRENVEKHREKPMGPEDHQ